MSMNTLHQTILPSLKPTRIPIHRYSRRHAGTAAGTLLEATVLGISISQKDDGSIDFIAVATPTEVYLIDLDDSNSRDILPLDAPFKKLLGSTTTTLGGFGMPRIALRLHHHLGYHVRGADLSTLCSLPEKPAWRPSRVVSTKLCFIPDSFPIDRLWHENNQQANVENVCLRAWISAKVAEACADLMASVKKVDTRMIRKDILLCLGKLLRQTDVLSRSLPKETRNEYEKFTLTNDGKMELQNARYKTRVRRSKQSRVIMTDEFGTEHSGRANKTCGKTTEISFEGNANTFRGDLQQVQVIGLDDPSPAEKARDILLLRVLQDGCKLTDAPFVRYLWFPTEDDKRVLGPIAKAAPAHALALPDLNASQNAVVNAMTGDSPLVIIHGPPGTGKTTTIAAATKKTLEEDSSVTVWIIGHSNVSVKNIAEKLFKCSVDFKLIVSKEFYVEWHEHIYESINQMVIRADELPTRRSELSKMIGLSRVILSTLGMLSNLYESEMYEEVPVRRLIVDEASQINVFEYMHIFHNFSSMLQKVCFFGDPKQLPPFGQENAKTLQSIFEITHLQKNSFFLDVQYRMPRPLGGFISQEVYNGRLKSFHKISEASCLRFVDVGNGEEERSGVSWTNSAEVATIVNLVRHYYRNKNFAVITPYDAQRASIERTLKREDLPWERVFNVDSFQGNEADYVLISVVRTYKIGFLHSTNRMNVMLTRCRAGMVIVTRKSFLDVVAKQTLLGRLSVHWKQFVGQTEVWGSSQGVMNQTINLPGAPGKHGPPLPSASIRHIGLGPESRMQQPPTFKTFDVKSLFRRTNVSKPTTTSTSNSMPELGNSRLSVLTWAELSRAPPQRQLSSGPQLSPSLSFRPWASQLDEYNHDDPLTSGSGSGSAESSPRPLTPLPNLNRDGTRARARERKPSFERDIDLQNEEIFPSLPTDATPIRGQIQSPWADGYAMNVVKDPSKRNIVPSGVNTSWRDSGLDRRLGAWSGGGGGVTRNVRVGDRSGVSSQRTIRQPMVAQGREQMEIGTRNRNFYGVLSSSTSTGVHQSESAEVDGAKKKKKNKKRNKKKAIHATADFDDTQLLTADVNDDQFWKSLIATEWDEEGRNKNKEKEKKSDEWQVVGRKKKVD